MVVHDRIVEPPPNWARRRMTSIYCASLAISLSIRDFGMKSLRLAVYDGGLSSHKLPGGSEIRGDGQFASIRPILAQGTAEIRNISTTPGDNHV